MLISEMNSLTIRRSAADDSGLVNASPSWLVSDLLTKLMSPLSGGLYTESGAVCILYGFFLYHKSRAEQIQSIRKENLVKLQTYLVEVTMY